MKIKLYGTGALVTPSLSACAMIDDSILFDCPNGLLKILRKDNIDFAKLKTIIISHYHADHDWDMPFLLWELARISATYPKNHQITIIAPKGFAARYEPLCDVLYKGMFSLKHVTDKVDLKILESKDKAVFNVNGYKIQSLFMNHFGTDAYGFRIERNEKTVAFTGDSAMCDNINLLVKDVDLALIDVTGPPFPGQAALHFDIPDYIELKNQHPKIKVLPIHMSQDCFNKLKEMRLNPPSDGDVFVL